MNIVRKNIKIYSILRLLQKKAICFLLGLKCVSDSSKICWPIYISKDFVLGEYSFLNKNAYVGPNVVCGNYVMFGPNVTIAGGDHRFDLVSTPMIFSGRSYIPTTSIGNDVWIGANTSIKAGVKIGNGSIIAMGSLVLNDVLPYGIYGGSPARLIKLRFSENEIRLHEDMLTKEPSLLGRYCD
ncbi:DapH/DapD/GlmU-related protein [Shewanella baltica]|uniref:DapH/DapD/GlmU-related protein n=1 Tax=Shewanella baltica TaxID=62322 RepID=UPI003D79FE37